MKIEYATVISEMKEGYKKLDRRELPPKMPPLFTKVDDAFCAIAAGYAVEVEHRKSSFHLDDYTKDKISRVARWIMQPTKRGLILMGGYGTGKSTMLRALKRVYSPCFCLGDAQTVFDYYKTQGGCKYLEDPYLLLDDLGEEPPKCLNYGEEAYPITRLLLYRYDRLLTTIIATNLDVKGLEKTYGGRLADRLYEQYQILPYEGESYRRQLNK